MATNSAQVPTDTTTGSAADTTPALAPPTSLPDLSDPGATTEFLIETAVGYGLPALGVLLILIVAYLMSNWLEHLAAAAARRAKLEETLCIFFGRIAKWGVLGLSVLACLGVFGVDTTSFAAVLASAGVAIGLALQGTLQNFSAGVMLLIFRPFKVGDYIETSDEAGHVQEIDLFVTHIDTLDKRRVILPNGSVFGEVITNYSHNEWRRVEVDVGVHYQHDIDETKRILFEALQDVPHRHPERPPEIYLLGLGASSVDYSARVWAPPKHYWEVREAITRAAKYGLENNGLTIPFPQLDVHFDRGVLVGQHQE